MHRGVLAVLLLASLAGAEDRALVVGVEKYAQVPPTPGSRRDAESIVRLLLDRYAFAPGQVHALVDEQATAARIEAEMRDWLVAGSGPGDRVFFYFSGHGTRLRDDGGDEDDGWDEAIVAYDVQPGSLAGLLRDDLFERLVSSLADRRVVTVFDSCHSGTMTRGIGGAGLGARYLPDAEQLARAGQDGAYGIAPDVSRALVAHAPFVEARSVGPVSATVAISAARPSELAYPVQVEQSVEGAFTYAFRRAHGDGVPTLRELRARVQQALRDLSAAGRTAGAQTAVFDVFAPSPQDDTPLFGGPAQAASAAVTNRISPIRVTLGTAEGRTRYRIGETATFEVTSSAAGHVVLLSFGSDGRVNRMFPSASQPSDAVAPGRAARFRASAQAPAGRDVVVAIVSQEPLALGGRASWTKEELFTLLNLEGLRQAVASKAGVRPLVAGTSQGLAPDEWQSATLVLETTP